MRAGTALGLAPDPGQSRLGLPPKQAAKLVRFDHAVHNLVAGRAVAEVAADGGYTDQSHLHRDVVACTGLTPATVVGEPFLVTTQGGRWRSVTGRPRTPALRGPGGSGVDQIALKIFE